MSQPADGPIRPNFFIIGAPKTGTTSLSAYLTEHPQVFFSGPKEPFYWNSDYPRLREVHGMHTLEDYLKLFATADPARHKAIGEGSTTYMQSKEAVKNIAAFDPNASVIAMLRNPVQVAHAMHGEMLYHFVEEEPDFEKAWQLQDDRAAGRKMPKIEKFVNQLQYREVATFAPQLRRLFEHVPPDRRLVILFDDFVKDTRTAYADTLRLLGLPDDGRTEFPRMNAARSYRLPVIGKLYQDPPPGLRGPVRLVQKWYLKQQGWVRPLIQKVMLEKKPRPTLRPEFEEHLRAVFRDDVAEVGQMLGRDLSHWSEAKSAKAAV